MQCARRIAKQVAEGVATSHYSRGASHRPPHVAHQFDIVKASHAIMATTPCGTLEDCSVHLPTLFRLQQCVAAAA